jgi:hypothetical protein
MQKETFWEYIIKILVRIYREARLIFGKEVIIKEPIF